LFTHLAVADDPADPFTAEQLRRFEDVRRRLSAAGVVPRVVHAANSAGGVAHPAARYAFVRAGIAIYGISPGPGVDDTCAALGLVPALALKARVSFVKRVAAGDGVSYGLRHRVERATTIATVPIGYADGVPRRLFATGGEVLLGGERRPIVGVVTMDQLMVDCGDDTVQVGDEVVLLGEQGGLRITAEEWADRLGTIGYEIVCGISARVQRL
jgi:alanine racemase